MVEVEIYGITVESRTLPAGRTLKPMTIGSPKIWDKISYEDYNLYVLYKTEKC
jgi:hypothetical protein